MDNKKCFWLYYAHAVKELDVLYAFAMDKNLQEPNPERERQKATFGDVRPEDFIVVVDGVEHHVSRVAVAYNKGPTKHPTCSTLRVGRDGEGSKVKADVGHRLLPHHPEPLTLRDPTIIPMAFAIECMTECEACGESGRWRRWEREEGSNTWDEVCEEVDC